jgi:hypothetical protein
MPNPRPTWLIRQIQNMQLYSLAKKKKKKKKEKVLKKVSRWLLKLKLLHGSFKMMNLKAFF